MKIRLPLLIAILGAITTSSGHAADEKYENSALNLLKELVTYRSAAGYKQVIPLANVLVARFKDAGFAEEDIHLHLTEDDTASLVVRLRGRDKNKKPVLFMGHMDIIDANPENWELDPFVVSEVEGKLIGRGVTDNKGGISLLTTTMIRLKEEGFVPERDIILALSGDEETTGNTTKLLYTKYRHLTDAEFAFNTDAGGGYYDEKGAAVSFGIQVGEKSSMTLALSAKNSGGHSSAPRDDNAIYDLSAALLKLSKYKFPVRYSEMTLNYFRQDAKQRTGAIAAAMKNFADNPEDESAANAIDKFPDIKGLIRTTCVATMFTSGQAATALPLLATATINCRIYPGETVGQVKKRIADAIDDPSIEITDIKIPKYAARSSEEIPEAFAVIRKAVKSQHPHLQAIAYMAPYNTDGKVTRHYGIPTYGVSGVYYAPKDGNSHGLNEIITKQYFFDALDYWYAIMSEL